MVVWWSIKFCTWQSKWVVNSTLVFFLWRKESGLSLVCAIFQQERCHLLLFTDSFRWRFDPEIGFIKWLQIHLSALRQQNLMNEPVPVRSAVSYCREQQGISSHTPFQLFRRNLVMCIPVSCLFTQHSDYFALQMELIYIQLLHLLSLPQANMCSVVC